MSRPYGLKLGISSQEFFNKSFKEHEICTQTQAHTILLTLHNLSKLSLNSFGNLYE